MAYFVELATHNHLFQRINRNLTNVQSIDDFLNNQKKFPQDFERTLKRQNPRASINMRNQQRYGFKIGLTEDVWMIYRWCISSQKSYPYFRIQLLHKSMYWNIKFKAILKNMCRTIKTINHFLIWSGIFVVINPFNGKFQLKIQYQIIQDSCSKNYFSYVITILMKSLEPLRSIIPIMLYTCNNISQSVLKENLSPFCKKAFYGLNEDFHRFSQIYQLLTLINSPCVRRDPQAGLQQDFPNLKRIISLYYAQLQHGLFKDASIYSQLCSCPEDSFISLEKQFSELNPTNSNDKKKPFSFVFNTIFITEHQKDKDQQLFEGGNGKIIVSQCKFLYSPSCDFFQESKQSSSKQHLSEKYIDLNSTVINKRLYQKALLVKIPHQNPNNSKNGNASIHYQKEILRNFRTSKSIYLPRYYHSVQPSYDYKNFFLMDHIQGINLQNQMKEKTCTASLDTKLFILSHISNAIRFLEQYQVAHLDLTPANIIVESTCIVKIIDFGQAYHPITSSKYSNDKRQSNEDFVYSPGRTFPYAPPQTTCRMTQFSSQQDMYSLGIIIYQYLFNSFPLNCENETLKELYRTNNYVERIFMAPQRCQYYGQIKLLFILIYLVSKMLSADQMKRPLPIWTYLIFKKLVVSLR